MYLRQLVGFFIRASQDQRIGAIHVAIYMSLFQEWCINECRNPVSISRSRIMELAKIKRTVYHKCIRELVEFGYIRYVPSYHPVLGSLVYLNDNYF